MTTGREYLRAGDIAQLTGVSLRTARRWIARKSSHQENSEARAWSPSASLSACCRLVASWTKMKSMTTKSTNEIMSFCDFRENIIQEHVPSFAV